MTPDLAELIAVAKAAYATATAFANQSATAAEEERVEAEQARAQYLTACTYVDEKADLYHASYTLHATDVLAAAIHTRDGLRNRWTDSAQRAATAAGVALAAVTTAQDTYNLLTALTERPQ